MSEDAELLRVLAGLRVQYLAEAPGRIADLESALAGSANGDPGSLAQLRQLLHRLAGSGGAYGLQAVTDTARAGELAVRALQEQATPPTPAELAALATHVAAVAQAFREAGATV